MAARRNIDCKVTDFISDHQAVITELHCGRKHRKPKLIQYRKINDINIEHFETDIKSNLILDDASDCLDISQCA